jgi:hypothetical protein
LLPGLQGFLGLVQLSPGLLYLASQALRNEFCFSWLEVLGLKCCPLAGGLTGNLAEPLLLGGDLCLGLINFSLKFNN